MAAPQTDTNTSSMQSNTKLDRADTKGSQTGVHPSAVGSGTQPDMQKTGTDSSTNANGNDDTKDAPPPVEPEGGYPEQKHAGAVGHGPNFNQGASFGDKITGIKEEIKGKITRKPDLAQHGKELRTGELKKKELEDDLAGSEAFSKPDEKKEKAEDGDSQANDSTTSVNGSTTGSTKSIPPHEKAPATTDDSNATTPSDKPGSLHLDPSVPPHEQAPITTGSTTNFDPARSQSSSVPPHERDPLTSGSHSQFQPTTAAGHAEKAEQERAATVNPEGTHAAGQELTGSKQDVKQIG